MKVFHVGDIVLTLEWIVLTLMHSVDLKRVKDYPDRDRHVPEYHYIGGERNVYILCNRYNKPYYQVIVQGHRASLEHAKYDRRLPLKIIIHGGLENINNQYTKQLIDIYLNKLDCNIILVDWSADATLATYTDIERIENVGKALGKFLRWLLKLRGGKIGKAHMIGFGTGAHILGHAGYVLGSRVGRLTALDPSGHKFYQKNTDFILHKTAAEYVEAIHTDVDHWGIDKVVGHVDFYVNFGKAQPGCGEKGHNCSHYRAYSLFISSLSADQFVGRKCHNVQQARINTCDGGRPMKMGNDEIRKQGEDGVYFVETTDKWPYYMSSKTDDNRTKPYTGRSKKKRNRFKENYTL